MPGSLRVIGGIAKGHKLRSVPGDTTRPVTDRVKEAIFNIIGPDIEGSSMFDLFAGTGAIGIEALSRGAAFVQFNDLNRLPVEIIRSNLQTTKLVEKSLVTRANALTLLSNNPERQFEYIYIAPPQYLGLWKEALRTLDQHIAWLSEDGWAIVQIHPVEYQEVPLLTNLEEFEQRKYGSTLLIIYQRKDLTSS
jgi:16S rRNA (guanine(966)-N(2))-methyltransferase RsmD